MARQVWKPFEWAEIPRIACIATGRPMVFSCRRPAQSVQGWSSTICLSNAAWASSAAMRLIVAAGNPLEVTSLADVVKNRLRFVPRQEQAGSHVLFVHLLSEAGIALGDVTLADDSALSEGDVAASIVEGKADAGFGIRASAAQAGLGFVKLAEERFDLVMRRRDWFEAPMRTLFAFAAAVANPAPPAPSVRVEAIGIATVTVVQLERVSISSTKRPNKTVQRQISQREGRPQIDFY